MSEDDEPIDDVTKKCLLTLASQAELWAGELMADAAIEAGLNYSVETPRSAAFAAIAQKLRAIRSRGRW